MVSGGKHKKLTELGIVILIKRLVLLELFSVVGFRWCELSSVNV